MNKNLIILFAALLAMSCNQQEKKETVYNDWFFDNLKGEVVSVESTPYKVDSTGKMGDMDSCCVDLNEYDKQGFIVKQTEKESNGTVNSETTFSHYDNGKMKEIVEMQKGKLDNKLEIQIDSAGNYIAATRYDSLGKPSAFYTDLSNNKYGNILGGTELKPDSSVKRSWKNMFNEQYFVGGETKDSSGKVIFSSEVTINDKGNRASLTTTNTEKDSTIKKSTTYQYNSFDEQGNWTERTESENGKPSKIIKRTITYAKKE